MYKLGCGIGVPQDIEEKEEFRPSIIRHGQPTHSLGPKYVQAYLLGNFSFEVYCRWIF